MSEHTPGPWTVSNKTMIHGGQTFVARIQTGRTAVVEVEGNVRLISAAPELLAALRALAALDDGDNSTLWPHAAKFERAVAAIAKAEGK